MDIRGCGKESAVAFGLTMSDTEVSDSKKGKLSRKLAVRSLGKHYYHKDAFLVGKDSFQ